MVVEITGNPKAVLEVPVGVSENDSNISRAELLKNYMPEIYHKISRLV
jgi:hypothetical protein